jgi:hypothetical protein
MRTDIGKPEECKYLQMMQKYKNKKKFWKFYILPYLQRLELRTNKYAGVASVRYSRK